MTSPELIKLDRPDGGVGLLTLDDGAHQNALSEGFVAELLVCLDRAANDHETKVLLIRGTQEVFCSGGDRAMLAALAEGELAPTDIMVSRALLELPMPTIAVMEGHAVGGGLTLGLCCDLVMMAEESSYGCSFMNMGFTPGMGTTTLLTLAVGEYLAAEMMYGGGFFRGKHFACRGINYVLPRSKLYPRALKVARGIAEKPRSSLTLLKRYLSLPKRKAFEEARSVESLMHEISFAQPETKALIEGYFPRSEPDTGSPK